MVAREGFVYEQKPRVRHTKCGRMRGMVVGEGGRSSGVLLYLLLNTAFLVYLNTYFMCDTWPYDS